MYLAMLLLVFVLCPFLIGVCWSLCLILVCVVMLCFIIGSVKQNCQRKSAIVFLSSIRLNMCFGCSKEPSH